MKWLQSEEHVRLAPTAGRTDKRPICFIGKVHVSCAENVLTVTSQSTKLHYLLCPEQYFGWYFPKSPASWFQSKTSLSRPTLLSPIQSFKSISCTAQVIQVGASWSASTSSSKKWSSSSSIVVSTRSSTAISFKSITKALYIKKIHCTKCKKEH